MYNNFTLKSLNSVCFTDLLQPWVLRMCTSVRFSLQEVSMMYTTLERGTLKPICTLLITCWTGGAISRYSKKRITWLYFCFRNIRCIRYDLQYFQFLYRVARVWRVHLTAELEFRKNFVARSTLRFVCFCPNHELFYKHSSTENRFRGQRNRPFLCNVG